MTRKSTFKLWATSQITSLGSPCSIIVSTVTCIHRTTPDNYRNCPTTTILRANKCYKQLQHLIYYGKFNLPSRFVELTKECLTLRNCRMLLPMSSLIIGHLTHLDSVMYNILLCSKPVSSVMYFKLNNSVLCYIRSKYIIDSYEFTTQHDNVQY